MKKIVVHNLKVIENDVVVSVVHLIVKIDFDQNGIHVFDGLFTHHYPNDIDFQIEKIVCEVVDEKEKEMNEIKEVIKDPVYPIPVEEQCDVERDRDGCWYCGGKLIWQSDFNYDEVYGEGEGIVTFLTCSHCGTEVQYAIRESEVTDAEGVENE